MTWRDLLPPILIMVLCAFAWMFTSHRRGSRKHAVEDAPAIELKWNPSRSVFDEPALFGYRIYTDRFDRIVEAEAYRTGSAADERKKLLDQIVQSSSSSTAQLSDLLRARGVGEGLTASILIDHSGSMCRRLGSEPEEASRHGPVVDADSAAAVAAGAAIAVAAALEDCGASVEILGFTTIHWRGGQSRRHWIVSGGPPRPGRLADLLHIIYKRMDERSVHDCSQRLEMLLDPSQLKENIDGEAIAWARQRLLAQPASDRLIICISDGAPVDDSTLAENELNYLVRHLLRVIEDIERRRDVRIVGIGVGYELSEYLPRSVAIAAGPPNFDHQLSDIADLISGSFE